MRVAGGRGEDIEENIQSNIKEYAAKVKVYDEDEEGERRPVEP
jgi:phospholipid:diacylglycerol acyltransferase